MASCDRGLVLLAQNDPVLSLDLADALEAAGYKVAGPHRTAAEAEAWLECWTPALAVIDVELADGSCDALAHSLRQRGIPFLIQTTPEMRKPLPTAFAAVPRLNRPAWPRDVVDLLGGLPCIVAPR